LLQSVVDPNRLLERGLGRHGNKDGLNAKRIRQNWRERYFDLEHYLELRRQIKEAAVERKRAENLKFLKACMRPPSGRAAECLFVRRRLDTNSSVRTSRSYIAPQIPSEVKEIQLLEKMSFNETNLPVIMRLFVC
jgi:hypothetical protein